MILQRAVFIEKTKLSWSGSHLGKSGESGGQEAGMPEKTAWFFLLSGFCALLFVCIFANTAVSADSDSSEETEAPLCPQDEIKNIMLDEDNSIARNMKNKCKTDHEDVLSHCTVEGLAKIQTISGIGQVAGSAIGVSQADGSPKSAKRAMDIAKVVSYSMAGVNTAVGARCLVYINRCVKSCDRAEKTAECLEIKKLEPISTSPPPLVPHQPDAAIKSLEKVMEYRGKCKSLKSNAYAALAQGAMHAAAGIVHGKMADALGDPDKEAGDDDENKADEPQPGELVMPASYNPTGVEGFQPTDSGNGQGEGTLAGNPEGAGGAPPPDGDIGNEGGDEMDVAEETASTALTGNSGASRSPAAGAARLPLSRSGKVRKKRTGDEGEFALADDSQSSGGFAGGFAGSSDSHYGSGGGYYSDDEDFQGSGDLKKLSDKKKEEDKLKHSKEAIGGKHENIFEKASKIIAAYCREGPIQCE